MERIIDICKADCSRIISSVVFLFILVLPSPALCDDIKNQVNIEADIVSYEEHTGIASADGNVKISNSDFRLFAPHAEYNGSNQTIEAFSDTRGKVALLSGMNKINGDHLIYNLTTRRGVLTKPSGKMDAFYMNARDVKVMPIEDAVKSGVLKSRGVKKAGVTGQDIIAEWLDVTTTTCDFENPHYRLVSNKIVIIPNKKVIIKNPKVYLGKTCIFTYPFDFVVGLERKGQSVLPFFGYNSDKGVGVGIKGPLDIGSFGELYIAGTYWTNNIWEAELSYRKEVLDGLFVFGESSRLYNEDDREILWRPKWGLEYIRADGWKASFYESQRELVETEMRPGQERRFNVWRSPEFNIYSPWFGDAAHVAKFRLYGIYGNYQDNVETVKPWVKRLVLGAELSGAPDVGEAVFHPYYGARYIYHDYESGEENQKVTDGWVGVTYSIGSWSFDSFYFRRWVEGASPLLWDRYEEREDFYQTVTIPLPFGESWEKWTFSVRVAYDNLSNEVAEMLYRLNYNKHCITWQLWAKDSMRNNQLRMGLTFYINAFPDTVLDIGADNKEDLTK